MFVLDKLVSPFLSPLGAALVLILLAFLLMLLQRRRSAAVVLAVVLVGLYGVSTPRVADLLAGSLEAAYPPRPLDDTPTADVIVVLGGATAPALPPRQAPELNQHADRLMHAADLYKAGKAPVILASGGNWLFPSLGGSEAQDMREILARFGVPAAAVVLEAGSDDTAGNARLTAAAMADHGWRTALLVPSGDHMPRAVAAFRRAGLSVIPSATDIVDAPSPDWPELAYLPSAQALLDASEALHELLGLVYYRMRGWI
jgi:uncharacterized SAM-binding protein YcdF (DUF218 family)